MADQILLFGISIEILALIISLIAIIFTLLKDFLLPIFFKPKLEFKYEEEPPYRREDVIINRDQNLRGSFLRFSVKNIGRIPALNCRCQIQKVKIDDEEYGDYRGFPLRWASRPESIISQASGERLNIARGETEFMDIAVTASNNNFINLQKYHGVDIGIKEVIEPGEYDIFLIFSGDNFKPYTLKFHTIKEASNDPNSIHLDLVEATC